MNSPVWLYLSFNFFHTLTGPVDAVYAMAHAIHQNLKDRCGDTDFVNCDSWKPAPIGAELLRSIREVSFVGMQGNQVSAALSSRRRRARGSERERNENFIFFYFRFSDEKWQNCSRLSGEWNGKSRVPQKNTKKERRRNGVDGYCSVLFAFRESK